MINKKVSVVIISWNVRDLILACIKELYGKNDIEIIVVDNNSSDDSVYCIQREYPDVVVIKNDINVGFARANNQGFEIASGEFIYILNPDTICTYESLEILLSTFAKDKKIGIAGPKIYLDNGEIQKSCARKLPTILTFLIQDIFPLRRIFGSKFTDKLTYPYNYEKENEVESISGAAMLVKRNLIESYGGFIEDFIHTGEDIELNHRIISKGYKIIYNPASTIIHYSGQSSKQAEYRITVNGYLSFYKYFEVTRSRFSSFLFKFSVLGFKMPLNFIYYSILKLMGKVNHQKYQTQLKIFKRLYMWKPVN